MRVIMLLTSFVYVMWMNCLIYLNTQMRNETLLIETTKYN